MQKHNTKLQALCKTVALGACLLGMFLVANHAMADAASSGTSGSIGSVATNIRGTFTAIARLIVAAAYVAGFGFAFASILKFKAHKDNPQQIPIGTPIALLFVGAALIFLPSVFSVTGKTIFGKGTPGGVSGAAITISK